MKEINKILIMLAGVIMFFFSCKTVATVNFENEKFSSNPEFLNNDSFYYSRIMTAVCVDLIIKKFSKNNSFEDEIISNVSIYDESNQEIFQKDSISLKTTSIVHESDGFYYKIYSYEMNSNELDRIFLKNYKTKFLILNYEIDGKTITEKLLRNEKKSFVYPT